MIKYKRIYNVILKLTSYKTDTDKYKVGEIVKIKDLDKLLFKNVIDNLNERLINMDFLGTNIIIELDEIDIRTILETFSVDDLVENVEIPGIMKIEINPAKVSDEEVEEFLEGILDIVKDEKSKVMAIGYKQTSKGDFKLLAENKKQNNTTIIDFVVEKMKEI